MTHIATGEQRWIAVGTVVSAAGSGSKQMYNGKEYDYVFKVDIADGAPQLDLPYNVSENPYDAAARFLSDNELPTSYLENVAKFIVSSTEGKTIGQGAPQEPTPREQDPGTTKKSSKYLPHEDFITIKQAKFAPIQKKILNLNSALIQSGDKQYALNPTEESILEELITTLNSPSPTGEEDLDISDAAITLVIKLATQWDYINRLPGLDLLRCIATSPLVAQRSTPSGNNIIEAVLEAALEPEPSTLPINENSVMMAFRTITNLFASRAGRALLAREAETVSSQIESALSTTLPDSKVPVIINRNVKIAIASAIFNYACLAYKERNPSGKDSDDGDDETLLGDDALIILCNALRPLLVDDDDGEVVYRSLMALGMILSCGGEPLEMANILEAGAWIREAISSVSESRVKDVGKECLDLLAGGQ